VSRDRVYGHTRSGDPITDKEIETLEAGRPYNFVAQRGEYEILDTLCMMEHLVKAQEGQQTVAETGCNIP
jgi:hypothetical protein